ncbi:MAG: flagellar hook-basal body complex protein FliE [Burkholderiaceae bacterium]
MNIGSIDTGRIESMLAQIKAMSANAKVGESLAPAAAADNKINFADVLKASLDQVSKTEDQSTKLGQQFALGDDSVNLSDVMISMQKASITLQTTVQVRNKLVSAYHDIMNMQV